MAPGEVGGCLSALEGGFASFFLPREAGSKRKGNGVPLPSVLCPELLLKNPWEGAPYEGG